MIIEENFLTDEEVETVQKGIIDNLDFPWYRIHASSSYDYPFYGHTLIKREEFIDEGLDSKNFRNYPARNY